MQTKNSNFKFIIITGMLILTTVSAIGFYISRPQATVVAGNNTIEQSLSDQNQVVSVPPQATDKEVLSQKVNEVVVEITSTKVISTGLEIGICYSTLDGGDWYPTPGHLFYNTYEIYPDEYEFTTEEKANGNKVGKRCALVRYRIDDLENITTPIEFTVINFEARPLEMFSACQNFQERLDTNPKAKAYGLKAKCTETSDGNISVTLFEHDKSVAKDKASKTLDEIAKGQVLGPWIFTINEIEK
ncbi:MAG: hypothetical protein L0287_33425 [Anaerolineae bacterium]|nr:hypothetical protein [Anaerolineae bacterium]